MYKLDNEDVEIVNRAARLALHAAHRINVTDDFAERFLTREVLRLYREGISDTEALAQTALGRLRDHVQARESARRLARPVTSDR